MDSLGRGEIWLRSPYLFLGYGGADPGSARRDGDWLTVGEIGWMAGGCLHLAGVRLPARLLHGREWRVCAPVRP